MTILSIVLIILFFGVLIAGHEFGHFIAAKSLGVRVEEFAIGMGPKLFSRKKGETTYSLRALPIGGFCAMEGEEESSDDPRSFSNKPAWKKLIILVAGAFMNFVAGLVIIVLLFAVSGVPSLPVVNGYLAGAEDIQEQGLLPGDEFYSINGHRIYFQSDALLFLNRAGEDVGFLFWHPDFNQPLAAGRELSLPAIAAAMALGRGRITTAKLNAIGALTPGAALALLREFARIAGDRYPWLETSFVWDNNLPSTRLNRHLLGEPYRKYEVYLIHDL